jgi:histidinol phosphatase-like enzyme
MLREMNELGGHIKRGYYLLRHAAENRRRDKNNVCFYRKNDSKLWIYVSM